MTYQTDMKHGADLEGANLGDADLLEVTEIAARALFKRVPWKPDNPREWEREPGYVHEMYMDWADAVLDALRETGIPVPDTVSRP